MNYFLTMRRHIFLKPLLATIIFLSLLIQDGNSQCIENFQDADNDGICDTVDQCPNFDDDMDIDNDGIPYCLDECIDVNENGICDIVDTAPVNKKLKIYFSLKRGFYEKAIEVILLSNRPNTTIHYTIGTNPGCPSANAGTLYSRPIQINNQEELQTLKVIGLNGDEITKVYTHTYIFNGFNLPTVVFSCSPYRAESEERETPISFEFIVPSTSPLKSVQEYAGTRTSSGGFHAGFSDKVYFRSAYGAGTLKEELFSDFYYGPQKPVKKIDQLFLRSNHSDESMLRQLIAHDALRSTGVYAPAGRFVYFYKQGKMAEIRHLQERPEGGFMEAQTGYDKSTFRAYAGNIHAGLYAKIRSSWEETRKAINIESFSKFLINQWIAKVQDFNNYRNYRTAGPANLDHTDGGDLSWHFFNWDMDLGYKGNPAYNAYNSPKHILRNIREYEEFHLRFADIVNCTMENEGVLTAPAYLTRIFERRDELALFLANPSESDIETSRLLNQISAFLTERVQWLKSDFKDKNYYPDLKELTYSLEEGTIASGEQLILSNPNEKGNIYYTLDGSDVRTEAGVLKAEAMLYEGPIQLNSGVYDVFARVYDPSADNMIDRWSATCGAKTFYAEQAYHNIIINEIHYNPKASINGQDTIGGKNYEFLELKNIGTTPIDLNGSRFSKGVELTIETSLIVPPNGFAVFADNSSVFQVAYGFAPDGVYAGKLNNNGEKINLKDPFGNFIDSVRYDNKNEWDEGVDSTGFSLELLHPSLDNNEPLHWFRSDREGGTPKAENSRTCIHSGGKVIINEINYNSNKDQHNAGDWVELYNPTTKAIDLSGWTLYDTGNGFIIPPDHYLGAGDYVVLVAEKEDFTAAFPTISNHTIIGELPFKLSNKGERITLFDVNKCLVDYVIYDDKLPWPEAADGDGPSLALSDPALDNALPESWNVSKEMNPLFKNGSPGQANRCLIGTSCNDGDDCTVNDVYDVACNCVGVPQSLDSDNDGICDGADKCDGIDDQLIGTACDDGDECTSGERFDFNCNCTGGIIEDVDEDGICDAQDTCNNIEMDCDQQGVLYERCDYSYLYEDLIITIFNTQDMYTVITDLATNGLTFYCDSWAETSCSDSLMIELEPSKQYEIRILNLTSRCESRDTITTPSTFIESPIDNAKLFKHRQPKEKISTINQNLSNTQEEIEKQLVLAFSPTTSIKKPTVYPNPVRRILNIDLAEYGNTVEKIRVVNSLGQEVLSQTIATPKSPYQVYQIDVASLERAVYFLQVILYGKVVITQKIIVK